MKADTINDIVEKIQMRTGLTQLEIAQRIGYSRPYFNRVLTGHADSPKTLGRLRTVFKEELSDMYNTTTTGVKVKTSNDQLADLEKRVASLENDVKQIKEMLDMIKLMLSKM